MGKYPVDITDEENAKLKYPFRPTEEYTSVHHIPGGPTVMITGRPENIPKRCIVEAVRINQEIALQRILAAEKKTEDAAGPENT